MTYQAISASASDPLTVVGYVRAFPRHPQPGTPVTAFETAAGDSAHDDAPKYALVAVRWATPYITVDLETGQSTTEYRSVGFGTPTGTTWYLTPVHFDDDTNRYQLAGRFAAGAYSAALPIIAEVADAPAEVRIHDFAI